jgi:guanyl-specific ribonuclease Sa
MKKRILSFILSLLCVASLLCGCTEEDFNTVLSFLETEESSQVETQIETTFETSETEISTTIQQESTDLSSLAKKAESYVSEGESYTLPEEVAAYLHIYSELPENFITKKEAQNLGWDSSKGNLWDVAEGKSIGGDNFGNYEGLLPTSTKYHECDVNYTGGYRQAERIIYGNDGTIYYTNDHYETFTQIY